MSQKILIVEDDPGLSETIESLLIEFGFDVEVTKNGLDALTFLESNSVDAILSDIMMPVLDGFEFLKMVRQKDTHTFFILMTGKNSFSTKQAILAGANALLIKPFSVMDLVTIVRKNVIAFENVNEAATFF